MRRLTALKGETTTRATEDKLAYYTAYPKQEEFHAARTRERLFMAGNQLGKTMAGAAECAMHLTGRYPEKWKGRRFRKPPVAWAAGDTGEVVRDTIQRLLVGRVGQEGTGFIPADAIIETKAAMGTSDLISTIRVQHKSGGESLLTLKSYSQGRSKFQGETLSFVWADEEPPEDIYSEMLTRTNATKDGFIYMTFTPLLGMSNVVKRFMLEESKDRSVTQMTIDDAPHFTQEEREQIIASYQPHELEARVKGIPVMGSGIVYPVTEEQITCDPIPIPAHWPRWAALDLGWDHPTAAVFLAWDRDADTIYVTDCYRQSKETPIVHAGAIKPRGDWLPVAWPSDGASKGKDGAVPLVEQYRELGLKMMHKHACYDDGSVSVEAGIMEILDRMKTGRFKVFKHLSQWLEERRLYHRKDGKIVKLSDDLLDATRYGVMTKRFAITAPNLRRDYAETMRDMAQSIT